MSPNYSIEIDTVIPLDATPVAVKTLSFATPQQSIATVLAETSSVLVFPVGESLPRSTIQVGADPIDICGGGRAYAYVACQGSNSVDVISNTELIKRIRLPGRPNGLAWNGSYNPSKQKIFVSCEVSNSAHGIVCTIDEETLEVSKVLTVGKDPRSLSLDVHRKHLFVANHGSDTVTVIDQTGSDTLATFPTAASPRAAHVSWSDPSDMIISLGAGGVIQRMDASHFPPSLSGLTVLQDPANPSNKITAECCLPIGEDNLWIAPDRFSESIALVLSRGDEFKQVGLLKLGAGGPGELGLGQVAVSAHGLPAKLYVANQHRKQLILASLKREKSALRRPVPVNREMR